MDFMSTASCASLPHIAMDGNIMMKDDGASLTMELPDMSSLSMDDTSYSEIDTSLSFPPGMRSSDFSAMKIEENGDYVKKGSPFDIKMSVDTTMDIVCDVDDSDMLLMDAADICDDLEKDLALDTRVLKAKSAPPSPSFDEHWDSRPRSSSASPSVMSHATASTSSPMKSNKRKRTSMEKTSPHDREGPWTLSDQLQLDANQSLQIENAKLRRQNNMLRKLLLDHGITIPGEPPSALTSLETDIFTDDFTMDLMVSSEDDDSETAFSIPPTFEDDEAAERARNIAWVNEMEEKERRARIAERELVKTENAKERNRRINVARVLTDGEQMRRVNESNSIVLESLSERKRRQKLASSATRAERKRRVKNNPNSMVPSRVGRWSKEEHEMFQKGLSTYGRDWDAVANYVVTRSTVQVRSHAQKYFKKLAKMKADNAIKAAKEAGLNGDDQALVAKKAACSVNLSTSQIKLKNTDNLSIKNHNKGAGNAYVEHLISVNRNGGHHQ